MSRLDEQATDLPRVNGRNRKILAAHGRPMPLRSTAMSCWLLCVWQTGAALGPRFARFLPRAANHVKAGKVAYVQFCATCPR